MLSKICATIYRLRELQKEVFVYSTKWVGDWILTDCSLFTIHKCASGQRHSSPVLLSMCPPFLPAIAKGSMSMEAFHSVTGFVTYLFFFSSYRWMIVLRPNVSWNCMDAFSEPKSHLENVLIIFQDLHILNTVTDT